MKYLRTFLFLAALLGHAFSGQAQKAATPKALIKRTYYDYQGRQLHEEYQYVSTPTNRFSKQGYYKEYNEDGTLWKKCNYRNNKAEGRQLLYYTSDGETWLEYDMVVHNDLRNGPYREYAGPNDLRWSGKYADGEKTGTWIEYGSDGSQQATYYSHDEPYTGTLEERFASGKLSRSVEYYKGMRFGLTQSWYPSGQLKSQTHYRYDKPDGATSHYDENGEPDAATKTVLAQEEAEKMTAGADSINQARNAVAAPQQQLRERHMQNSVRRAEEATAAAKWAEAQKLKTAEIMLATAYAKQQALVRAGAQAKLCVTLYHQLITDCQATSGASKLPKAQRVLALMNLAEALHRGEQPDLSKAIRKENDLDKVLTLTGI